ncbi:MAG: 6-phosphogluconolactonase [Cyanobacteriota bacterium]|nr:6-phosphogluconolactonase [Cyanobacteriota bacterium]
MLSAIPELALQVLPDAAAVAERVASLILQARLEQPQRPLGLATGRTMEPVYAALRERLANLSVAERTAVLRGWQSFNLDEYVGLGPADPGSFAAVMHDQLAVPLGLASAQMHLPDGLAPDPAAEARRYAAAVAAAGGIGLQLLGLGLNGHVGFNEPPCGPDVACRCLTLSPATRAQNAGAFGGDPDAVPPLAITLGLAEILAARELLLVVTGAAKAPILKRLLHQPASDRLPASWLRTHPRLTLLVDQAAAAGAASVVA